MPGWSGFVGEFQVDQVLYNTRNLDDAGISLRSSTSLGFPPIQGNYSVFLQGASIFAGPYSAAIAQSGLIPFNSKSLMFLAAPWSTVQASFAGQLISLVEIGSSGNNIVLGGDISQFAGHVGELRFTTPPTEGAFFDNIQFSTHPIPEPSAFGLLGVGMALMGMSCWTQKQRSEPYAAGVGTACPHDLINGHNCGTTGRNARAPCDTTQPASCILDF